jgi:hypothetical protein
MDIGPRWDPVRKMGAAHMGKSQMGPVKEGSGKMGWVYPRWVPLRKDLGKWAGFNQMGPVKEGSGKMGCENHHIIYTNNNFLRLRLSAFILTGLIIQNP